ncbi:hypothetical protein M501DRAFT_1058505 [Patellaria atrata CBS 101060]|uniref:GPCPD1-like C2 domain-containing protein n=1 Tax=Patellaria atrata CBS 101060 TaxID=1346257 RepID=A0A9P4S936_9PEZI|nr:hypothetical protein M501DRAFT_1058505 [Patellaria atrata CBS 101060]
MIACIYGHSDIVDILLASGADPKPIDPFSLSAQDYAAYSGFLSIAGKLRLFERGLHSRTPNHGRRIAKPLWRPKTIPLSKIFVNLGTLNTKKRVDTVDLGPYLQRYPTNPYPETSFSVSISGIGAAGFIEPIRLPILDDRGSFPSLFLAEELENAKLVFNISRFTVTMLEPGKHIGTAIALLSSLKQGLGADRESSIRDYTIPIYGNETMCFMAPSALALSL